MSDSPVESHAAMIRRIRRAKVDTSYLYDSERLLDEKIEFLAKNCSRVLDFGRSSRERFERFHEGQAITCDINQYDDYPDVIDDLCDVRALEWGGFDGIVCMAILEHVYAPHLAVDNLHRLLEDGGHCLVYAPFLWRYHGAADPSYLDYFRFSRDGLAYLFRDFSEVTIYPFRGRFSTLLNLTDFWKPKVEKRFGQGVNRFVDRVLGRLLRDREQVRQASGYFLWARK